jgi:hypothetical protein
MVNLRKVGAVATGALFVGATLGMAAAVTVPADFKASMLADKGVAKAQLVVGKNAPGRVEDTASAEIIQEAVKTKLAYTVPGGDIEITYGHYRWDDTSSTTRANLTWQSSTTCITAGGNCPVGGKWLVLGKTFKTTTEDGNITNVNKGSYGYLRIDKNGDGDFKDTADYNIYSGLYIIDGTAGTVQFVFNFSTDRDSDYSTNRGAGATQYYEEGVTFKVKGKRYTFSKEEGNEEIKLAPTLRASAAGVTQDFAASATTLDGTKKIAYRRNPPTDYQLYFYDGTDYLGSVDISSGSTQFKYGSNSTGGLIKEAALPSAFKTYRIWVKESGGTAYIWAVRKDDEIEVVDEQKDVLGYYQVRVNDTGFVGKNGLYFLSAPLSLKLDGTVDVPGTEYEIKWKTDKTLQLKRKTSVTVASGTKLKSAMAAYKDFLSEDIKTTGVNGDIEITYGHYRWDDTSSTTRANLTWQSSTTCITAGGNCPVGGKWLVLGKTFKTTTEDGNITNVNKGSYGYLRIDKNGDGDFKDTADYNIYSGLYIIDGTAGTVQFVFNFSTDRDSDYSTNRGAGATQYYEEGVTFKVKGKRYTFSKEEGNEEIKLAPTLRASAAGVTQDFAASATTLDGTKKIAYRRNPPTDYQLYFYDGTDYLGSVDISSGSTQFKYGSNSTGGLIKEAALPSAFKTYRIWVKESGGTAYIWAVRKDDEIEVVDEQKDVLGYYQVRVNDTGFVGKNGLYFLSAPLSLKLDGTVDVPGTEYEIKWKTDKTLQLKRKTSVTVASGTKLKSAMAAYKDFLSEDIKMTLTGVGETKEPVLEIVDEDTASSTMNLVLIGGPVANSFVADLVTAGRSKVDWYTSDGDIEVVSDYPSAGFTGIIVAGKTRTETAAAAKALADAL